MKTRTGFVSNSSSSSFMISLDDLTAVQLVKILDHIEEAKEMDDVLDFAVDAEDAWDITIKSRRHKLHGSTFMDNFDMHFFLQAIGVDMEKVSWSRYGFNDTED